MFASFQTCQNDMMMLHVLFTRITRTSVQRAPVSRDTRHGIIVSLSKKLKETHKAVSFLDFKIAVTFETIVRQYLSFLLKRVVQYQILCLDMIYMQM